MSVLDNFKKDLKDNEESRNAAHKQIDAVHDAIKTSIETGISTFNSFFGAASVPVAVVSANASVAGATTAGLPAASATTAAPESVPANPVSGS